MSKNPVHRKFSRHIDIRRYFIRELVKAGIQVVKLIALRTHKMVADALTKSLPSPAFIAHRKVMLSHVPFALKFLGSCRDYVSVDAVRGFKFIKTRHAQEYVFSPAMFLLLFFISSSRLLNFAMHIQHGGER